MADLEEAVGKEEMAGNVVSEEDGDDYGTNYGDECSENEDELPDLPYISMACFETTVTESSSSPQINLYTVRGVGDGGGRDGHCGEGDGGGGGDNGDRGDDDGGGGDDV